MIRIVLVLAALLLAWPAPARAGGVQELRHGPVGGDCRAAAGPKEEARVKRWAAKLGGKGTTRAWRVLLRQGAPGCSEVVAWLVDGGPGLEPRRLADAARNLVERGEPGHAEASLRLLDHEDPTVTLGILEGLEKRLAILDEQTTERLLLDARDGVAEAALALFAGHHSEGRVVFQEGVPVWEETAYWGARGAPPQHYAAAVERLAAGDDAGLRELAAKYLRRHGQEGHPGADAWGGLLVSLSEGRDAAATLALEGLGWAEPPALDAAEGSLLSAADPIRLRPLIDGLEGRLEAGRGTVATVDRLRRIASSGERGQFARAERLVRKWGRLLEPSLPQPTP